MTPRKPLSNSAKLRILDRQANTCALCQAKFISETPAEFDHIQALVHGGDNSEDNYRALCGPCHREKSAVDVKANAKVKRIQRKLDGTWKQPRSTLKGRGFDKRFRKRMDGTVEKRT